MKRLDDLELDSLYTHGISSGTATATILRDAIVKAVTELREHRHTLATIPKRFFRCEDNGEHYDFVAATLEHAQAMLAASGMTTAADDDKEYGTEPVEWSELALEQASMVMVNTDEDERGRGRISLSACDVGEWFSTVY